ncbi:hypothetical protein [Flavonifractor hominis]|uniref:Secreted protein n=1 Tax=Flavonifractor hominis TaxID=3133178 RepID=A0ABV1ENV8_9FIRM
MCCCNRQSCRCQCCCGCGNGSGSGNSGITTLPSFPDLPVYPGNGTVSNTRWPVYVSVPAFLWETDTDDDTSGCGCCRG